MKVLDIPKSGKCGDRVWQSNRYCQYSYPAFVPFNPRTPAQTAVRGAFAMVSARWRTLTQAQRDVWIAVARTMKTKPRLDQCGVMPGFNLFIKVNVPLANQGQAQFDLPPGYSQSPKPPVGAAFCILPFSFCLRGGAKRPTGSREPRLRYRSCPGVPPYLHRSSTLGGRWIVQRCSKRRIRSPCRSQPVVGWLP
jgi:hypothetical protein